MDGVTSDGSGGYLRTVLVVLVGWISGTLVAGFVGLFGGLLVVAFARGVLKMSVDHAVALAGAVIAVPSVVGMTVASGLILLKAHPGRPGVARAERTVTWLAATEAVLLIPSVGIAPWLNGGRLLIGPPWSWPLGVVAVGLLARGLALHAPPAMANESRP